MSMLRRWWIPFSTWMILTAIVFGLLISFFQAINLSLRTRSEDLGQEMAQNFRFLVENHAKVLQTIGELEMKGLARDPETYLMVAEALMHNYDGFFAVNLISDRGVITGVHPLERNRAALGRNLLEREALSQYLIASRDERRPMMSHRIRTYQGMDAFVIYVPIFENGRFTGWLNGVVDLEGWFRREVEARGAGSFVRLQWKSDPKSFFEFGRLPSQAEPIEVNFRVWNQDLSFIVALNSASSAPFSLQLAAYSVAALLVLIAAFLIFSWQNSLSTLKKLNHRLRLKNALVSSLAHDMGTPMTVLSLGLERLRESPSSPSLWERVRRSTETLRQMLDSVRLLHAMETGRIELRRESVDLAHAAKAAIDQVAELASAKSVMILNEIPNFLAPIVADRATLSQNVIPNVLTNAIKFSPVGGVLTLRASSKDGRIRLAVKDSGEGIPPAKLREILDEDTVRSSDGTSGEKGSGLGMIQVRTFMEIYGGSIEIHSSMEEGPERGTTVCLDFLEASA